ncbi:sensor histidine kinase [uncultured Pigmentiphaga sp.]|uniref:sensor histidine kinase n=1 Tax=uncultured Pigmentiphaga sp. TaxID=340361 RepID=UPI0026114262|nr:sensor histidine kinase [uncultured Pigmentiphaga sp.]
MDDDRRGLTPVPALERPARSLFGEILDWMLVPLFLLWPISVAITYVVAQSIAVAPYDRALANTVLALAQQVQDVNGRARLQLPDSAREMLRADETDSVFYLVLGSKGEYLGGDRELPLPSLEHPLPGIVQYRDDVMRGFAVRVAYTWVALPTSPGAQPALVQVAETLEKRSQLANEIIKGVILPQVVVLPLAVVLVWFGLSRGIAPLGKLQERLRARRPDDLSPIDEREVPQEIAPLVRAMNELLQRLSANVAAQKRFVADAAHQMKTPLAGIRTQAELALRNDSPEDMQASLRHLIAGAERATRLVNQLLALARAEDTGSPLDTSIRVDLQAIASEQTQNRVQEALAKGIDLGLEGSETPVEVSGNALLLAEMISNLIDNALRYAPSGAVTVRVTDDEKGPLLEVEDSGPGIPAEERELVFDRFYRILGSEAAGSGLGLAIVREIAQRHRAVLSISDNPRSTAPGMPGTRISVRFPPHSGGRAENAMTA